MSEGKLVNRTLVTILAVVGLIVACICILFGVLFMWAAFSPEYGRGTSDLTIGIVTVSIGLVIVALAVAALVVVQIRKRKEAQAQTIVQKIDLSGDIALDKLKCKVCGAELDKDSIAVKEGAVFVSCPFCGSTYQIVEEPKW